MLMKPDTGPVKHTESDLTHRISGSISIDTLARIDHSCRTSGFTSWDAVVASCEGGGVFRISFAERRPIEFVKELTALMRSVALTFGADRSLQLYLGRNTHLQYVVSHSSQEKVENYRGELLDFGHVRDDESKEIVLSPLARGAHFNAQKKLDN
jgi:hypothetical protein